MENSNPLRNLRCHHCAGPLSKEMVIIFTYIFIFIFFLVLFNFLFWGSMVQETSEWTVAPLVRDSFSMIGSAVGGTTSAFYGFNHVMPIVRRYVKGPMWVHFLVGAPPVIVFSSACAGLAGEKISLQWSSYVIFIEMIQFFCNETISRIKNSFLIIISSFYVSRD
ncbi:hypothetical protein J1N35_022969 [Gossypium stocksii]|uniref:Uncharacterized protein n=1 Tax=Gossypium stocksii TaxID=47602 RepID=A0A9D3VHS0_9ROSI|nr:hypothetical protein J1N35_022969 [Gossypium stocksii]